VVLVGVVLLGCLGWVSGQANPISKCPQLPPHTPANVRDLHPNNIKVVMALGDSVTAGFGLMGVYGLDTLMEWRGKSHAMGGDPGETTLPNFFKHFSPNLTGASMGHHLPELPNWEYYDQDYLNAAQSDARVGDLMYQIKRLLLVLKNTSSIDIKNDWKFLNLFIGINDACPICWDDPRPTVQQAADVYERDLAKAIQAVHDNIPRVFFNILPAFNASQFYTVSENDTTCRVIHDINPFGCPCAFDATDADRDFLDTVLQAYNDRANKLAHQWQAKNLDEFVVQTQNYTATMTIPNVSYLSNIDCMHPSLIFHQGLAITTWNSLISPVGQKPTGLYPNVQLKCPTKDSRLYV